LGQKLTSWIASLLSAKCWSGRRESNPRMKLGKQAVCEGNQELECKKEIFGTYIAQ
jgi:hypothetical protein